MQYIVKYSKVILCAFCLAILSFLFFYKLGNQALQSYDEAWYGSIARNILISKNIFQLEFNHASFIDHPPIGFWLMAIPISLFGSSELSVRLISALAGIGTVFLIFKIGLRLGGWKVGVAASSILISSMWFMLRARSGNLDIPFVFFEVLLLYSIFLLEKYRYAFYLLSISFALLLTTKTLVGIAMLPTILVALWYNRKLLTTRLLVTMLAIFTILVSPWYVWNYLHDSNFLYHHFIVIGTRGETNAYSFEALHQTLFYIQVGIGKWYKLFFISVLMGSFLFFYKKIHRYHLILLATSFVSFAIPLLFSTQTEVWHLLPLYPFIALCIAFVLIQATKTHVFLPIAQNLTTIVIIMISLYQFNQFSNILYNVSSESSEKQISLAARDCSCELYLFETFYPSLVYYSQQKVYPLSTDPNAYQTLVRLLANNDKNTEIIINNNLVHDLKRDAADFEVITNRGDYWLVR